MNYEFMEAENLLIIKLSGTAEVNERLLTKDSLTPYLRQSCRKVIVDLGGLEEMGTVYVLGILNTIKKEFQLVGGEMKLCSMNPNLYRYFKENRMDQIFDIGQSIEEMKAKFMGKGDAE